MASAGVAQAHLQDAALAAAKQVICDTRAEGWSEEYCAAQAGIKGRTLRGWLQADPEFAEAWAEANIARLDWFEDVLRKSCAAGQFVPALAMLKSAGRIVEKGNVDPEQLAQAIIGSLRQLAAEQRRLSQPQIAPSQPPDRAIDISSIVRSDTPDSHSQPQS